MYRPDGISDGANTIQGVRTTDSSTGAWTTPDALAGTTDDPGSQNAYGWVGNNPIANGDPTGNFTILNQGGNSNWLNLLDWSDFVEWSVFTQIPGYGVWKLYWKIDPKYEGSGLFQAFSEFGQPEFAVNQPVPAPSCRWGAYGSMICQGANYKPFPMPNIMSAGTHPGCAEKTLNGVPYMLGLGAIAGGSYALISGGSVAVGAAAGTGGGVGLAAVFGYAALQDYTGVNC